MGIAKRSPKLALVVAMLFVLPRPPLAAEMSCIAGATCTDDLHHVLNLVQSATWYKGVCKRVEVNPVTLPCARAVGRIESAEGIASGFVFMHPREFMTNVHTIGLVERVSISFYTVDHKTFKTKGTVVKQGTDFAATQRPGTAAGDWAIVVLDTEVPGVMPLNTFSGDWREVRQRQGLLMKVGYGGGGFVPHACKTCSAAGLDEGGLLRHSCGSGHGDSGSPLMYQSDDDTCTVIGMDARTDAKSSDGAEYIPGQNGNTAVYSPSFVEYARNVKELLEAGFSASQIKQSMYP